MICNFFREAQELNTDLFLLILFVIVIILMMNLVYNVFYTVRKWNMDQYFNVTD